MLLNYINWDINPEIFGFWGLSIRYYGLLFAASFFFGYLIMQKIFKQEGLTIELLDKLTIYMALGTVLGARLGHCLFYQPDYYLSHPWEIIKIWHGGLASHGAAIGILISLYYFSKKNKKPYLWIIDRIAIVVALAGFFIRMGNLMNSEIYGNVTTLPWGFVFLRDGQTLPKHPTQIYEALSYLTIFVLLYSIYRKKGIQVKPGLLVGLFFSLLFTVRFFVEFIKEDQVRFEQGMSLNMGQWLSIPLVLLGLFLLYRSLKLKPSSK
ncbi:MAG: prolipoprotein diacylglyceryl transferase [Bacteroidales bacterium]|nr:prolipoprotein diacylglyceryl transferase [Bacteroidales bacterium]